MLGYVIVFVSPQVDLRRGFFQFPLREAHIKNPNNKTVPEGVMQGLSLCLFCLLGEIKN